MLLEERLLEWDPNSYGIAVTLGPGFVIFLALAFIGFFISQFFAQALKGRLNFSHIVTLAVTVVFKNARILVVGFKSFGVDH